MNFQQIRNATAIITYAGSRFLIDPLFAPKDYFDPIPECFTPDKRWPLVELPMPEDEITRNLNAVIVTHSHIDHIDEFAAKTLPKAIKIFVQDEYDENFMRKFGFTDVEILKETGTVFNGITLYKTGCIHGKPSAAMPYYKKFGFRPDAMGVVFKATGEKNVYLAGDTIWCDFIKNAVDKFAPEIIIVNAAAAQLIHSGPIIMGTEDIAALRSYAPNAAVIATHMDAVGHATLSRDGLRSFITANKLDKDFYIPADGETLAL